MCRTGDDDLHEGGSCMRLRIIGAAAVALLIGSLLLFGAPAVGSTRTSGTLTRWAGNPMQGASYTMLPLDGPTAVAQLTIAFSGAGSSAPAYCGVGPDNPANSPPAAQNRYSWIARWGFDMTHAQGRTTVNLGCQTTAVLVAVQG